MADLQTDDADLDALLGKVIVRVGESPKVAAAAAELEAQIAVAAAQSAPSTLVDPRTLPVRFSRLKQFALSAAHYNLSCQGEVDETIALRLGSGVHAGLFLNRRVLCYHGRRQGKAWERFERRGQELGAVILSETEYAIQQGMIEAVRRHARATALLFDGTTTERTIEWRRDAGARQCRGTPDAYLAGARLVELKSTRCAEPRWLSREAIRRFYHAQLSWYDTALGEIGADPDEHIVVAVENVPPFNVTVLRLTDEVRELGAKLCVAWWERLRSAETTGHYGGYIEADVDLELPEYESREPVTVEVDGQLVTID